MIYLELFWSFFQIGLFSIGGGYAAMPLIQDQVVDIHPWLTMTGFADIMAIAEMTPGPIALNAASLCGNSGGRPAGSADCHYRLYLPILRHCDDFGLCVLPLPWFEHCARRFGRAAPRCDRYDCICRYLVADSGTIRPTYSSRRFEQL